MRRRTPVPRPRVWSTRLRPFTFKPRHWTEEDGSEPEDGHMMGVSVWRERRDRELLHDSAQLAATP